MFARLIPLLLAFLLTFPATALTPPAEGYAPWGESSVEAKGKGKNGKRARFKTVTRTVKGRDANSMVTGYTTTIT